MNAKIKAQAARFGRLFGVALVTQVAALQGQHLTRTLLVSVVVGAVEVAWRQYRSAPDAAQHRAN